MVIFGEEMAETFLKRCPFCGGKVKLTRNKEYKRLEIKHMERPDDCPMYKTWLYDTEEAAVEAWNKRYTPKKYD